MRLRTKIIEYADKSSVEEFVSACCYYCGATATTIDHVPPKSIRSVLLSEALSSGKKYDFYEVDCCKECNSLLSDKFWTLAERKAHIGLRLKQRHRKILQRPNWSDMELANLSDQMRTHILAGLRERDVLKRRLQWALPKLSVVKPVVIRPLRNRCPLCRKKVHRWLKICDECWQQKFGNRHGWQVSNDVGARVRAYAARRQFKTMGDAWRNSPKGKEHTKTIGEAWRNSPEGKKQFKTMGEAWNNSPENMAQLKIWNNSLKGKKQFKTMREAWNNSPEGKEHIKTVGDARRNSPENREHLKSLAHLRWHLTSTPSRPARPSPNCRLCQEQHLVQIAA